MGDFEAVWVSCGGGGGGGGGVVKRQNSFKKRHIKILIRLCVSG